MEVPLEVGISPAVEVSLIANWNSTSSENLYKVLAKVQAKIGTKVLTKVWAKVLRQGQQLFNKFSPFSSGTAFRCKY